MNKFKLLKDSLLKIFVIFLGFIIFALYFWNRFLRERTSKDLPLSLNIIYLIVLIYICILFSYLIYSIIFPRKNNIILADLVELLFMPLKEFDIFIKTIPFIKPYYQKIMVYLIEYFAKFIINSYKYFYIFWLFPRMIILFAFILDIFVFQKFHYKYMVISFGLLLFFNQYFMYSIKYYKQERLTCYSDYIFAINTPYIPGVHPSEFEADFDPDDDDFGIDYMELPLKIFLDFQTKSIVYENNKRDINSIRPTNSLLEKCWIDHIGHPNPNFFNKPVPESYTNIFGNKIPDNYYKAVKFVYEKSDKFLAENVESLTRISVMIEYHKKMSYQDFNIKIIKIIIYVIYLICWLYVLYISMSDYTLSLLDKYIIYFFLNSAQDSYEVFSGLKIDFVKFFLNENFIYNKFNFTPYLILFKVKLVYFLFIMIKNTDIIYIKSMQITINFFDKIKTFFYK